MKRQQRESCGAAEMGQVSVDKKDKGEGRTEQRKVLESALQAATVKD
jgi:hypothetical protein